VVAVSIVPPGIETGRRIVERGSLKRKEGWGWVQTNFIYITIVIQIKIARSRPGLSVSIVRV
jgi:hypothetical protein